MSKIMMFWVFLFMISGVMALDSGTMAPNFTLENTKGEAIKLDQYKDKTVVLEWFNKDCPFVKKHYDSKNMQSLQKKYTDKGIVWLSIVSSAKGNQGYMTKEEGIQAQKDLGAHPTAILIDADGKVGKMYGAKTTPHMYIVDKGKLIYQGAIDSINSTQQEDVSKAKNYVAMKLDSILDGKTVNPSKTKPYGCSVKY